MTAQEIIESVAETTGVSPERLLGNRGTETTVKARFLLYRRLRDEMPCLTLYDIARITGRTNISSITYGLQKTKP